MDNRPVLILADPMGKAWDFAQKVYQKLNSNTEREIKYKLGQVEINKFNDGEIFTKILENVREYNCFFIHDSSMPPQDWFVSLRFVNDALMRSSAGKINDVLPYMKYSRQDRMVDPRTPISASVLAEMLNTSAQRVITTDLHNPAIQGAYKIPFDNLKAYPVIIEYLKKNYPDFLENAILVAPDVGSAKRVESYSKRLNLPVAIANKTREQAGIVGEMTIIGDIRGKNTILIDDMIDTGGTLIRAAEVLKQKGAMEIWACATHGIFSKDAIKNLNNSCLKKIIITDSLPQTNDNKVEVVSLSNLIAETIYRISHGISVSELFR